MNRTMVFVTTAGIGWVAGISMLAVAAGFPAGQLIADPNAGAHAAAPATE